MRRQLTEKSIETLLDIVSEDWDYSVKNGRMVITTELPSIDKGDYKRFERLINGHNIRSLWIEIADKKLSTSK